MKGKKPGFWLIGIVLVVCLATTLGCVFYPVLKTKESDAEPSVELTTGGMSEKEGTVPGKLLGELYADVCNNTDENNSDEKELIQIWLSDVGEDSGDITVEISSGEQKLYEYVVSQNYDGWINVGLILQDGEEHLIEYSNRLNDGEGSYGYEIFRLDSSGKKIFKDINYCEYNLEIGRNGQITGLGEILRLFEKQVPLEELEKMQQKLDGILPKVMLLACGNIEERECYAFSQMLQEDSDWSILYRPKVHTGLEVFWQGLGLENDTYKVEIAEWYRKWLHACGDEVAAKNIDNLDGLTIYDQLITDSGEYLLTDYIPGDSVQLLQKSDGKWERLQVWIQGEDYWGVNDDANGFSLHSFENLLGYEEVLAVWFQTGWRSDISYYHVEDDKLTKLAESWGCSMEGNWQVDIDNNGTRELICQVTYYGDGVQETLIYRNVNGDIVVGNGSELMDEPYENLGVGSCYCEYLPQTEKVRVYYYVRSEEDYRHKDYNIDFDKLSWTDYSEE